MIEIRKSATADTRTCDFANTTKGTLLDSSRQHIGDVVKALAFFVCKLTEAAGEHDYDKLTAIDWFHSDFVTGFKETGWWDNHRKIHRHHINMADGVPADLNLLDVLEHIADCVMAGMARSGSVYELKLDDELLQRAFQNTVTLLSGNVRVIDGTSVPNGGGEHAGRASSPNLSPPPSVEHVKQMERWTIRNRSLYRENELIYNFTSASDDEDMQFVADQINASVAKQPGNSPATSVSSPETSEGICGAYAEHGFNEGRGCPQPKGHLGNHGTPSPVSSVERDKKDLGEPGGV